MQKQCTGPPWPDNEENSVIWVRPGQAVVETPGCGSSLAKQWRERWGTDPPWSGSEENPRIWSALVRQWGKFQDPDPSWPSNAENAIYVSSLVEL
ncbi:hypothetical protein Y032_0372g149 [Ancylostoma ceylanicum]|uniref:Uncharacterized protein n=1 Tax=Ancylostoma ceylanicum TaxID=53326 RepID=A0A016RU83_9BILA|nr:hypothetical protein Y032_0372g149 [Ancylostoma ceylanicum]